MFHVISLVDENWGTVFISENKQDAWDFVDEYPDNFLEVFTTEELNIALKGV